MKKLDNLEFIRKKDRSAVLESVRLLPEQINQAWEEVLALDLAWARFKKAENMVAAGMGGSALGAFIIDSLGFEVLNRPLEIVKGYHLPAYANDKTLMIASSYSGQTEETLSCFKEALARKCLMLAITTGGKLAKMAKKNKVSCYKFNPRFNPSGQPRLGLGYSITAQLAVLAKMSLIRFGHSQINQCLNFLNQERALYEPTNPTKNNLAKKIALAFKNKAVLVIGAEHLIGVSHAFKNMLNENGKTFAVRFSIPELNHHLLEGLTKPPLAKKVFKFLFLESNFYNQAVQKRMAATGEIIGKNGYQKLCLKLKGETRLTQVWETVFLGGFVSAYLALLYGLDPGPIPWVNYFKKKLKKQTA